MQTSRKDWINIAFLTFTPVVGVVGTALYTWHSGFHLWMPILTIVMYLLIGFSICAGYHRYFSHKSYECSPLVQVFFAFFGGAFTSFGAGIGFAPSLIEMSSMSNTSMPFGRPGCPW